MIKKDNITSYFSLKGKDSISLKKFEKEEKILLRFISDIQPKNRLETVFLLDMYLKGVRSFFQLSNHPKKTKDRWNFIYEINILKEVIKKSRLLYNQLFTIDEGKNFINFIESKFKISLEYLQQSEDEKKNWKFDDWINNFDIKLKEIETIVESLSKLKNIFYREFITIGDLFLYYIVENPYIYPFVRRNFKIEIHRVVHTKISAVVHNIEDKNKKYSTGINILEAFKILKSLEYTGKNVSFEDNYFLFVFLKEELEKFKNFETLKNKRKIKSLINEIILKIYNVILANIFNKKKRLDYFEKSKFFISKKLKEIIFILLKDVDKTIIISEIFPDFQDESSYKKEILNSLLSIEKIIKQSINGNIENYKKELLINIKYFESSHLPYISLKYWERFYRLFFAIKHSPHKYQLIKRIIEFNNLLSEIKEDIVLS